MDVKDSKTFLLRGFHRKRIIKSMVLWEIRVFMREREENFLLYLYFSKIYHVEFFFIWKVKHKCRPSSFSFDQPPKCLSAQPLFHPAHSLEICFMFSKAQIWRCLSPNSRYLTTLACEKNSFKICSLSFLPTLFPPPVQFPHASFPVSIDAVIFYAFMSLFFLFFFSSWVMSRYLSNSVFLKVFPNLSLTSLPQVPKRTSTHLCERIYHILKLCLCIFSSAATSVKEGVYVINLRILAASAWHISVL